MGISSHWVHHFFRYRDLFCYHGESRGAWISIGSVDYNDTRDSAAESVLDYGFMNKETREEILEDTATGGSNVPYLNHPLHRQVIASLVDALGYSVYREIDISSRADIVFDLNHPLPTEHAGQYDLVYDAGTLEHVSNSFQAMVNAYRLAKVGGKIIHSQGIGDQTDHGYWSLQPGFLIDFYQANGCSLVKILLCDNYGKVQDLEYQGTSIKGVTQYLAPRHAMFMGLQMIGHALMFTSTHSWVACYWRRVLKILLGKLVDFPNVSMIAIFKKSEEVKKINTEIQGGYSADPDIAATLSKSKM